MFNKFIISFSFPRYWKDKSGMSKVILEHQKMYNNNSISYIYLFSVKKMIFKDRVTLFSYFGLSVDGKYYGVFSLNDILKKLDLLFRDGHILLDIHIHHLLYMNLNNIDFILQGFPNASIKFFLHDYYLCCTNYNLMKNGEIFCGGKGFSNKICEGCKAYKRSMKIEEKISKFLLKYKSQITFISPSEITKNIFLNFHEEYIDQVEVIPHQKYVEHYIGNLGNIHHNEKIKVGFLAMPKAHKGWQVWEHICEKFKDYYEFYVFNSSDDEYNGMNKIKVEFSDQNLNAMVDAIRKNNISIILLWSLCPETYSYTCFEAYSSNAFILTNRISGNICDVVTREKNGLVFNSVADLDDFLSDIDNVVDVVNFYKNNGKKGPLYLKENDYIVKLSKEQQGITKLSKRKFKISNKIFIFMLNKIIGEDV